MWNTRRLDEVSGYYLYKYRHYDPALGRWPSRDPIEEEGGVNIYGFVRNNPVGRWDKLGLTIVTDCPMDKYFKRLGLKYKRFVRNKKYHYSEGVDPKGKAMGGTALTKLILTRMMKSMYSFHIEGKLEKEEKDNISAHIATRKKIIQDTRDIRFSFGPGDDYNEEHTATPIPELDVNPQAYYNSLNQALTTIGCLKASEYSFYGATGSWQGGSATRSHLHVWIPGDWGYIANKNYNMNTWKKGFEGENIIHVGKSKSDDMYWGFTALGSVVATLPSWKKSVNSWQNVGKTEKGKAELRSTVDYPTKGLEQ